MIFEYIDMFRFMSKYGYIIICISWELRLEQVIGVGPFFTSYSSTSSSFIVACFECLFIFVFGAIN